MLSKFYNRENESGFTLIELLVVILIIGILAAIAVPMFLNQRKIANEATVKSDLQNAAKTMETEYIKNKTYPNSLPPAVKTSNEVALTVKPASSGAAAPSSPIIATVALTASGGQVIKPTWRINGAIWERNRLHKDAGDFSNATYYTIKCSDGSSSSLSSGGVWNGPYGFDSWVPTTSCWGGATITGMTIKSKVSYGENTTSWGPEITYEVPFPSAATNDTGAFCIEGVHSGETGNVWKYDSRNGGLVKGSC